MAEQTTAAKGTCFVVMGFGKKTDFETGRTLDLDKSYRNIIKPAVTDAGLECVRADEITHSGIIDVPMYEKLLTADVVIADLSTSNKNAYYELGVRHALRPHTTIVICEDGAKSFPFDVNHVVIRQYHHMGEGIDFEEVQRFRTALTGAIKDILDDDPRANDSPVYTFLNDLTPPMLKAAMRGVAAEVGRTSAAPEPGTTAEDPIYSTLMEGANEAQAKSDFATAKVLLSSLRKKMKEAARKEVEEARKKNPDAQERPEDPDIIQRLALVTYKSNSPTPEQALTEARELLLTLNPLTSNDTETLGLWGAVHKRFWGETKDPAHLAEAVRGYERGFYLRNDYYNGINLAYLLNVRASSSCELADKAASPEEATRLRGDAIACFVRAGKVRTEVLEICDTVLNTQKLTDDARYWVLATKAEAYAGIGDEKRAQQALDEALALPHKPWMKDSTEKQMAALRELLKNSPLRFVRATEA